MAAPLADGTVANVVVLVDEARWKHRGLLWCHLISDTSLEELHRFALVMAIPTELFHGDHYDLPQQYRDAAIAQGAQPVSAREVVRRLRSAGLRVSAAERRQVKAAHARVVPGDAARQAWVTHIGSPDERLGGLLDAYAGPGRHYHGLHHVDFVVRRVQWLADVHEARGTPVAQLRHVVAAALYHDVIYSARPPADQTLDPAPTNEEASARLAEVDLAALGWHGADIESVAEMIRGTTNHAHPPHLATAVLFDADLAVLGAPPEHYDDYVVSVRREYHHVPDEAWRTGRPQVLHRYLERANIYATDVGRERWEEQARLNIENELAALS